MNIANKMIILTAKRGKEGFVLWKTLQENLCFIDSMQTQVLIE